MKCSKCGQELPAVRLGALLTPTQARVFDAIERANGHGVESGEIAQALGMSRNAMKVHVCAINEQIGASGFRLVGSRGPGSSYTLVRS